MYPSPLKGINSTVLSKSQTWMTAATQQRVLNKEELLLERYPNVSWSLLRRGKSSQQYDMTSFANQNLAIICHSSPHLFTSQALSGWMGVDAHFQVSPEIFDWVQSQAVAGSLKNIHRVVYKPLLLCASGHCPVGR